MTVTHQLDHTAPLDLNKSVTRRACTVTWERYRDLDLKLFLSVQTTVHTK